MDIQTLISALEVVDVSSLSLKELQRFHDVLEYAQVCVEDHIALSREQYRYIPAITLEDGEIQLFKDSHGVNRRRYTPLSDISKCWYCDEHDDALKISQAFLDRYSYSGATACVMPVKPSAN